MHSSIGTGTLAYTVGSKVMDARISSQDSMKKEAKSASVHIALDSSRSHLEHTAAQEEVQLPKITKAVTPDVALKTQFSELSGEFGSGRVSGVSNLSGPLYNISSPSAHGDEGAESEVSDFSFTNGDFIAEFPYLPTVNLFAKEDRKQEEVKTTRSFGKPSGNEGVDSPTIAGSLGAGAAQGEDIFNQGNAAELVDNVGMEVEKHVIYGSPIKFDDEPNHPQITAPAKGPNSAEKPPFLDVSPSLLDESQDAKSPGTGVLDFPYTLKNGKNEEKVADWRWTLHRIGMVASSSHITHT